MRLAIDWLVMLSAVAHAGRSADQVKKLVDQQLAVWSRAGAEANLSSNGMFFDGARFTVTGNSASEDHPSVDAGDPPISSMSSWPAAS